MPWLSVSFSSFSSAPPGSDPQPLLPSLDSVPSVLPSWLFSSHHPPPPTPGIGSQASRMTFMGMSWVGVRTVPISTPVVSGMTMAAKDSTTGSVRLD